MAHRKNHQQTDQGVPRHPAVGKISGAPTGSTGGTEHLPGEGNVVTPSEVGSAPGDTPDEGIPGAPVNPHTAKPSY